MSQYQVIYVVNGQPVDVNEVPPYGIVEVLHLDGEELIYGEDVRDNRLHAITCRGTIDTLEDDARQAIVNAVDDHAPIELSEGVPVAVYFDPTELALGFEAGDNNELTAKAQFTVAANPDEDMVITLNNYEPYVVEELSDEPVLHVYRRGIYNTGRQLVCFNYPLFTLDPDNNLITECGVVTEYTPAGEQEVVTGMDAFERDALAKGATYLLPAFSESQLAGALPYLEVERQVLLDPEGQPLDAEAIASYEAFFIVGIGSDDNPKIAQNFIQHALTETDIYQVPPEMHWHVFHAYLKQLHENIIAIAMGDRVSHYVRVHSEGLSGAIDGVEMAEGDRRIHTSVFHLNGELIEHECYVVNAEGEPQQQYSMNSPIDFGLVLYESDDFNDPAPLG